MINFYFQGLNLMPSSLLEDSSKNFCFFYCSGILIELKRQKMLLVFTCLDNYTHFSSTLPAYFSYQGIDGSLFTQGGLGNSVYHENCSLNPTWGPDWPIVAEVLLVWTYFSIVTYLSQNVQLLIF